jgi:hypothetical protein
MGIIFSADHIVRINSSTLYSCVSSFDVISIISSLEDSDVRYDPWDFDFLPFYKKGGLEDQFSKFGMVEFFDGGMNLYRDSLLLFTINMTPVDFVRDNHDVLVDEIYVEEVLETLGLLDSGVKDCNDLSSIICDVIREKSKEFGKGEILSLLLCLDRLCSYCDEVGCGVKWSRYNII